MLGRAARVPEGPWAALYRGRGAVPGCVEPVAALLAERGLEVRHVGPGEKLGLARAVRSGPTVLAHPGGGELEDEWRRVRRDAAAVRDYVAGGGSYLGLCLGAYLAGATPGYDLLPGDTDQWCAQPRADVRHTGDALTTVRWEGMAREVYVQDAPVLEVDEARVRVVARYGDGGVAALRCGYGAGRVVVCGPHPEAPPDWSTGAGLVPPRPPTLDLARRLVSLVLDRPGPQEGGV